MEKNKQKILCTNVFKNEKIDKKEYTKLWIELINQKIKLKKL